MLPPPPRLHPPACAILQRLGVSHRGAGAWVLEGVCSQISKCEGSGLRGAGGTGRRAAVTAHGAEPPPRHRWLATDTVKPSS